jgi:hypothetical protein
LYFLGSREVKYPTLIVLGGVRQALENNGLEMLNFDAIILLRRCRTTLCKRKLSK